MATPAMDKYDYIELVIYDVHCLARGRLMARRRMDGVCRTGMGLYAGLCYFGALDQPGVNPYFGASRDYGNSMLKPVPDTLCPVQKSARGKYSVGQVMCYLQSQDGSVEPTTPRTVATIQLDRLKEMGFSIRNSFELEFAIRESATNKNFGHASKWADLRTIDLNQELFLEFIEELDEIGVKVDTLMPEAGPGQYEMTLDIEEGIKGPDATAKFKNAAKVFFNKRGLDASFMTKIEYDHLSNGFHFNHSLWTADGKNAFLDKNSPDSLSELGRHWLAGLAIHAPAMTALSNPTINCYRRLHQPWAPTVPDWGNQNRCSSFRLKVEGEDNVYIEDRLPSSACNPYFVMAGVLAAGMDGIQRKLRLEDVDKERKLPADLDSALKALQEDTIMVEALGKEFVDIFEFTKREYELKWLQSLQSCGQLTDKEQFEKEYDAYFHQC